MCAWINGTKSMISKKPFWLSKNALKRRKIQFSEWENICKYF